MNEDKNHNKETEELRKEWSEFKRMSAAVAGTVLLVAAGYGVWVGTIQANIQSINASVAQATLERASLNDKVQNAAIAQASITAQLENIQTVLLRIENALNIK